MENTADAATARYRKEAAKLTRCKEIVREMKGARGQVLERAQSGEASAVENRNAPVRYAEHGESGRD